MEVTRYMGWRRDEAGYGYPGCDQSDIDNQKEATMGSENIYGISNVPATYIVTNIEDSPLVDSGKLLILKSS